MLSGRFLTGLIAFLALAGIGVWVGLPKALNLMGLHPNYDIPEFNLSGHRALIITTSVDTLAPSDKPTGVASSKMTIP